MFDWWTFVGVWSTMVQKLTAGQTNSRNRKKSIKK
jgi:hypothetical protein